MEEVEKEKGGERERGEGNKEGGREGERAIMTAIFLPKLTSMPQYRHSDWSLGLWDVNEKGDRVSTFGL